MYKRIREQSKSRNRGLQRSRFIRWRREPAVNRIDRPTKLTRARSLGYKPKKGVVLARVRIRRGGRKRPKPSGGRGPKHSGLVKFSPGKSHQAIAEERASRKFKNMTVLNSYLVGKDGVYKWFEVILTKSNKKGRSQRGLTSAGKKYRGLR